MPARRGRVLTGGAALLIVALFAGHWGAEVVSDRWWAAAVDPAAAPFLMRWHLLGLLLDLAGIALAAAWCVGHLLFVVGSIGSVQVPRRLGDLEIREVVPHDRLRSGAIVAGIVLGVLVGSGTGRLLPLVLQGWRGVHYGIVDPLLGLDIGIYLAQLPLWDAGLEFCRHLVWVALGGAGLCHLLVGGARVSRRGLAMTDAARVQLGLLVALALALGALGEGLGPLRAVAGLETGTVAALAPATRWVVAGIWGVAAIAVALWTVRPTSGVVLVALALWMGSGLLSRAWAPGLSLADRVPVDQVRRVAAVATGLDHLRDEQAPPESEPGMPPAAGLWAPAPIAGLLHVDHGAIVSLAPAIIPHGAAAVPSWLALRRTSEGADLVAIADDRLAPGGAPVSFSDQDGTDYPGVVTWRRLDPHTLLPARGDTIAPAGPGGVLLGGLLGRLLLAWGTQSTGLLASPPPGAALFWRLSPRERAAGLFPPAWWGEPRPVMIAGRFSWVVEGWLVGAGAPFAPAIPWEGEDPRYLRPAFDAVIDATTGATRLYLRPEADPLALAWAASSDGGIAPADSLPAEIAAMPMSDRDLAVKGYAVSHGAYGFRAGAEAGDSLLTLPTNIWTSAGPAPELPISVSQAAPRDSRLDALLVGGTAGAVRLIRWAEGGAPRRPRTLEQEWRRFATYERLLDSVTAAGGRLVPDAVRYEVGPHGTVAMQPFYATSPTGAVTLAWVQVARADRLGAARTPASAWANLRGESVPLIPAPDLPDPLVEARRWAARADSLLRAGDLEGFGRAFGALKRVLGTP